MIAVETAAGMVAGDLTEIAVVVATWPDRRKSRRRKPIATRQRAELWKACKGAGLCSECGGGYPY